MEIHTQETTNKCTKCDKSFTSLIKLEEHFQMTHNPPLHLVPNQSNVLNFKCLLCDFSA